MDERSEPPLAEEAQESEGEPLYNEDGVDLTLVRWMLSLTYAERLRHLEQCAASAWKLKNACRKI